MASLQDGIESALRDLSAAEADPLELLVALFQRVRPARIADGASGRENFSALIRFLEHDQRYRDALRETFLALFGNRRQVSFYTDSGILPNAGALREMRRCLARRMLPELHDEASLKDGFGRIFHERRDHRWLAHIAPEDSAAFWKALALDQAKGDPRLRYSIGQMLDALQVLSHRVSAMGLEPELLRIAPELEKHGSPFFSQSAEIGRFADAYRASLDDAEIALEDEKHALVLLGQCRDVLASARRKTMSQGTSLSLTYLLVRLYQTLKRMEDLLNILGARFRDDAHDAALEGWVAFIRSAVRDEAERHSLRSLGSRLLGLLALRITDNAGRTGGHYITSDRAGYFGMWCAAAGGGLIIGAMALAKILASKLALAPFIQAFLYSMNYGLGFVLIHMLHFTVATKQPAMTAAAIAATVSESGGASRDLQRLADLVVDVLRSQFAAICGNVLVAVPTAICIGLALAGLAGYAPVDAAKAQHLLHELSPVQSLAVFHAAIAGVCLFLAGLISGYFDNFASYARIPERVVRLRWLQRSFGTMGAARVADYLGENLGGLMGNFLFGIMLGSMSTLGFLFGLPLDIRHIAFSSANFGYALAAMDFALSARQWIESLAGLFLIGFTNLAVSFSLALWLALKSRGVDFRHSRTLLRSVATRFLKQPHHFFLPPSQP